MRQMLAQSGLRHYLYGGTDEVLVALRGHIARTYPGAVVVGHMAPPFRPLDDTESAALTADLKRTRPDVVWVGLGTPKQDMLVDRLVGEHDVVAVGVGAAFDFLSGQKREAPPYLHRTGLEWLYRLITEPRRLWRRYLIGNVEFAVLAFRGLLAGRKSHT